MVWTGMRLKSEFCIPNSNWNRLHSPAKLLSGIRVCIIHPGPMSWYAWYEQVCCWNLSSATKFKLKLTQFPHKTRIRYAGMHYTTCAYVLVCMVCTGMRLKAEFCIPNSNWNHHHSPTKLVKKICGYALYHLGLWSDVLVCMVCTGMRLKSEICIPKSNWICLHSPPKRLSGMQVCIVPPGPLVGYFGMHGMHRYAFEIWDLHTQI